MYQGRNMGNRQEFRANMVAAKNVNDEEKYLEKNKQKKKRKEPMKKQAC